MGKSIIQPKITKIYNIIHKIRRGPRLSPVSKYLNIGKIRREIINLVRVTREGGEKT